MEVKREVIRLKDVQSSKNGVVVFVKGLPENTNEDLIYDMFQDYGNILEIERIFNKRTNLFRGCVLIKFEGLDEAKEAIDALNGK